MRKLIFLPVLLVLSDCHSERKAKPIEKIKISYQAAFQVPANKKVQFYFPLPREDERQKILSEKIEAPVEGIILKESKYNNRYWYAEHTFPKNQEVTIRLLATVRRSSKPLYDPVPWDADFFLKPNKKVPVNAPFLQPYLKDIPKNNDSLQEAKAIYQFVLENMEYKKVGTGWGQGDTYWACSKKYGNCTDFHALFISLARSRHIPARFEIGFPIPQDRAKGEVKGYHCWLQFYADGKWFPVDASEAWKHPEKRKFFFGNLDAGRVLFTVGRDIQLKNFPGDFNYFIYPVAVIEKKAIRPKQKKFTYEFL